MKIARNLSALLARRLILADAKVDLLTRAGNARFRNAVCVNPSNFGLALAKFQYCARMSRLRLLALLDNRFDLNQPFAPVTGVKFILSSDVSGLCNTRGHSNGEAF